jgi:hypothetical protein
MKNQCQTPQRISLEYYEPDSWSYQYAPFHSADAKRTEIPAFEIFGDDGEKIADTNESLPRQEQEQHAKLIAAAPKLVQQVEDFIELITAHQVHGEVTEEAFEEEITKAAALIRSACLIGANSESEAP